MTLLVKSNNSIDGSEEKRILKEKIKLLKEKLFLLTEKTEQLKVNLIIVKQEFNVRIGRLYLKLDQLNFEILRLNKIRNLLKRNFTISKSEKIADETLKSKKKTIDEEYEKLEHEEEIVENRENLSEKDQEELKKLWRKLARLFHPDLAKNEEDRIKREKIMSKINQAYAEGDLETLKAIEEEHLEDVEEISTDTLKRKIEILKNAIIRTKKEYLMLLKTEWYIWKKNVNFAKAKGRDLFAELEHKLIKEIKTKETLLNNLQKQHEQ